MKSDIKNIDYEINKEGNVVFTRDFLLRRGFCCGNKCLHCPYEGVKGSRRVVVRDLKKP